MRDPSYIYTNTIIIDPTTVNIVYKYGTDPGGTLVAAPTDDEAASGQNHGRVVRTLTASPYQMPVDTFGNQYNEPYFSGRQCRCRSTVRGRGFRRHGSRVMAGPAGRPFADQEQSVERFLAGPLGNGWHQLERGSLRDQWFGQCHQLPNQRWDIRSSAW